MPNLFGPQTTSTFGAAICTDTFTGTSASAPLVSGVIALTLQAKLVAGCGQGLNLTMIGYHVTCMS